MREMNEHESSDSAGYWPAYVDVIINVTLNVIFITGVLAAFLSVIDIRPVTPNLLKSIPVVSEQSPFSAPKPQRLIVEETPHPRGAGSAVSTVVQISGQATIQVSFQNKSIELDKASSIALQEITKELESASQSEWVIWCFADTRQDASARLAYLRMMSVRNSLLQYGISAQRIETRMLEKASGQGPLDRRVLIARFDAKGDLDVPVVPTVSRH